MNINKSLNLEKNRVIRFILILVIFLVFFTLWEIWGRTFFWGDRILVFAKTVEPNVEVSYKMLKEKRVNNPSKDSIKIGDANKIVGKETNQKIRGESELFFDYFSKAKLNANATTGTKIFAFPKGWLESYPQTLRRGDTIAIYSLKDKAGTGPITKAKVSHVKDKNNQEIVSKEKERLDAAMSIETIEVVLTNEQMIMLTSMIDYGTRFVLIYE